MRELTISILHAFLDGRDKPTRSAKTFIFNAEKKFREFVAGRIATISGRYYGMDRLRNIAPALLKIMGLPQSAEMTGHPLIEFE